MNDYVGSDSVSCTKCISPPHCEQVFSFLRILETMYEAVFWEVAKHINTTHIRQMSKFQIQIHDNWTPS